MRRTRYIRFWLVSMLAVLSGGPLRAQFNGVQVNVNQFGLDILGDAANEPSIAVDPNDPNRIAIGWRQFNTTASNFRQAGVAYSTNGGQSWSASILDPGQFRSDPVLDFDVDGNFYYSSLSSVTSIQLFKSTNGGMTWSNPIPAFGGDKQWIAVDRTSGPGRGNIYQHWNVQFTATPNTNFTRSTNGGNSFETAISGPQAYMKWGTVDVGHDGTLYLVGATLNESGHLFSKSTNAQNPLQTPTFSMSTPINLGGTTSGFAAVNPAGLLGQVTVASDHSYTDSRGNIYVLASVERPNGDPVDVMFIRSTDGGSTWSSPLRVNNDPGNNAYQWFGMVSVAPNGRIDAVWNDTRNSPNATTSELFYAYSFDEGQTWQGNTAISAPFNQSLGYPNQDKLGDYYDLVSDNSSVYVAYAATFNGGQDVYFRRIEAEIPCDFDNDRLCNVADIDEMLGIGPIVGGVTVTPGVNDEFDLTADGVISLADRDKWLALAGSQNGFQSPYKPGDANLDGFVDGQDFIIWNENKFSSTLRWSQGNYNGDSINDGEDFLLWNSNKFTASDQVAVPEPITAPWLLIAVAAYACRRSQKP